MKPLGVLLVALLLLGAGCTGQGTVATELTGKTTTNGEASAKSTTDRPTATTTRSPTPTPTPTATPSPTPEPLPENPWEQEVVTVGIEKSDDDGRNYAPLVQQAIEYWNTNGSDHGDYAVQYELEPNATRPDIGIEFVDHISECGIDGSDRTIGCAPLLSKDDRVYRTVPVRVETGYSNESTVYTIKHEIGHTRGLDHSYSSILPLMNATAATYTLPQTDAKDRAYPWETDHFRVYIDTSNVSDHERDDFREQAKHALDYYSAGPEGYPSNFSYVIVDNESRADILIRDVEDADDSGSAMRRWGNDPDGDGRIEYFDRVVISLSDLDTDRTGYHVAYWIGFALGAEERSELPPPLQEGGADPDDDWWN